LIITARCEYCSRKDIEVKHIYRHQEAERLIKEMGEGFTEDIVCIRAYLDRNSE
jgi:hypothetical protein